MSAAPADAECRATSASLATYPMNRFARDFVTGDGQARKLLDAPRLESLVAPGTSRGTDELAAALIRSNASWSNDVSRAVARWREGSSVALIAGQQVGFGGGPLYTLAKIASLLKIRNDLEARGVPATVFFWLATEDHDFDEATTVFVGSKQGMQRIRPDERPQRNAPVGRMQVPETLRRRLLQLLPGAAGDWWAAEGISLADSFARLISAVFTGDEIVLVDSLLPELRQAGAPLMHRIVDAYDQIEKALAVRSGEIRALGYDAQVVPDEEGHHSLLFMIDGGERLHLRRDDDGFRAGDTFFATTVLHALIDEAPEKFSTGALTRPLLQDEVLAPELFVGGPAEVAYYAQLVPIAKIAGVSQAAVALRGHVLPLPRRSFDLLESYRIEPRQLFDDPAALLLAREPAAVKALEEELRTMRAQLEQHIAAVEAIVMTADRGMKKSIDRSLSHLRYHLERLGERSRRAIARRDRERYDAVVGALNLVAPERIPQDRKAAWLPFWLQHGRHLVDRMIAEVEPQADVWKIIAL